MWRQTVNFIYVIIYIIVPSALFQKNGNTKAVVGMNVTTDIFWLDIPALFEIKRGTI
jgi:hypothetical protein